VIVPAGALHYLVMIPVQLEYTAPAGCPTQAEFVAFVANRGGDFAHPGPKTKARAMVVTLRREADEHAGSLELRADDLASDARQLRAANCTEVAEALAVVAAIALRGSDEAAATVDAQPAPSAVPAVPTPVQPAPAAAATSAPSPRASNETRLRTIGWWGNDQLSVTAGPLQVKRSLAATLSGGVVLGAIPGVVLPRYDLTLTRANFITTPQHESYLIGSVFGVRWSYFGDGAQHSGSYVTHLNGFKAGALGCASLTYDTTGFVALFCSGFMVGLMHLDTHDTAGDYQKIQDIGFGAASMELNGRYNFGKYVHLGLLVGGDFWVGKLAAARADGSELFHSRLFNANLQLGLGVNF
jgi:hypothetical protein